MSGSNEADPQQAAKADRGKAAPGDKRDRTSGKKAASRPADVGRALRSVYDDTLREDIPSDLRELLGRLG